MAVAAARPATLSRVESSLESRLKAEARRLGFALSGIAPAVEADGFARYEEWLARGYAGEMQYLHEHAAARRHPGSVLDGARSVLMLGMEYQGASGEGSGARQSQQEPPSSALAPDPLPLAPGRIAAYAAGPDYHRYIWDRLNALSAWLARERPGCRSHGVTDTAPLLERDFARRAGLGWVGKNTMLLDPRRGSFFFLAALLTDLELAPDSPFAGSHCGTCTACLDACPTQAFPEPYVLDATRCISYLTIELRSSIPHEHREAMGNWLYGCDVCQEVCPWNRKAGPGAFPRDPSMEWLDPVELLGLDAKAFRKRFKSTSLWRNRRAGLLRNAAIVLGNVADERALPALEKAKGDTEDVVREAAAWAIDRIRQRTSSVNSGLPSSSSD